MSILFFSFSRFLLSFGLFHSFLCRIRLPHLSRDDDVHGRRLLCRRDVINVILAQRLQRERYGSRGRGHRAQYASVVAVDLWTAWEDSYKRLLSRRQVRGSVRRVG